MCKTPITDADIVEILKTNVPSALLQAAREEMNAVLGNPECSADDVLDVAHALSKALDHFFAARTAATSVSEPDVELGFDKIGILSLAEGNISYELRTAIVGTLDPAYKDNILTGFRSENLYGLCALEELEAQEGLTDDCRTELRAIRTRMDDRDCSYFRIEQL